MDIVFLQRQSGSMPAVQGLQLHLIRKNPLMQHRRTSMDVIHMKSRETTSTILFLKQDRENTVIQRLKSAALLRMVGDFMTVTEMSMSGVGIITRSMIFR